MNPEVKTKKQVKNNSKICNFLKYMADRKFSIVWIFLVLCFVISLFGSCSYGWGICRIGLIISLVCFIIFLFHKPLNVVYGLIGTKGHIRTYLIRLVVINVIFSLIYQFGFFKNAGITYDINQPYISYNLYEKFDKNCDEVITLKEDTTFIQTNGDPMNFAFFVEETKCKYQPIRYLDVLKNTLMTSFMQEPCDFFAISSTYTDVENETIYIENNGKYQNTGIQLRYNNELSCEPAVEFDRQKSDLFHWLLILQVFISWILFGVFISILYNKFRYES